MGKYIIELERGETAYKTVNSNGKPMIQLLAPTPYTEPDLEQVKADAYLKGLNDGQGVILESTQNNAFNNGYKKCLEDMEHDKGKENSIGYKIGYKKGYIDGLNRISDYEDKIRKEAYEEGYDKGCNTTQDRAYQRGLSDAWEAARKIAHCFLWGSYQRETGRSSACAQAVLDHYSASEAIEKIRQYEQGKEEIKVGDEVIPGYTITDPNPAIVTRKWKDNEGQDFVDTIGFNGNTLSFLESHVDKTGRHFPEIAEVLKKMREE